MKWIKQIYACFNDYKLWFLILIATNFLFIFLAWLAYPETFVILVGLMIVFMLTMISLSIFIIIRKQVKIDEAFEDFLLEPNDTNEERLCQVSPETHLTYIRRLGNVIRSYQSKLNDQVIELTDYESYIEGWVHEVKKPLSLMTLILDNRIDEMSPLVRRRMLHVRDQMLGDVEKILYFARLGAAHKDYNFESISLLAFCKETIKNNQTLLDESGFYIHFTGEEMEVLSDRKGLTFMLEQIVANSTKYITQNNGSPMLKFETNYDNAADEIILNISDNGPGIAEEDLPFIFDKGFTGRRGAYTREATGMGLFLVKKMAYDLAIHLDVKSELGSGLTISLIFPNVKE
ncbi:signal transduction histidine kinase [Mobilisporobacter senegalensis]|uniref:histidine kinase n=1 Tax=Mobilisporobacter senegalensis TaxID=1329262 RepID=A0A3N1XME4_9FIRM|nr:sensor histidine kinase [Mobilisporobacter senegalensis]ROR25887.1 signal transduction histidine kinase [Mobilisporobacter senegalensis]